MFFYNTFHFEEAYSRTFKQANQWYLKQKRALLQSSVQGLFSKKSVYTNHYVSITAYAN